MARTGTRRTEMSGGTETGGDEDRGLHAGAMGTRGDDVDRREGRPMMLAGIKRRLGSAALAALAALMLFGASGGTTAAAGYTISSWGSTGRTDTIGARCMSPTAVQVGGVYVRAVDSLQYVGGLYVRAVDPQFVVVRPRVVAQDAYGRKYTAGVGSWEGKWVDTQGMQSLGAGNYTVAYCGPGITVEYDVYWVKPGTTNQASGFAIIGETIYPR